MIRDTIGSRLKKLNKAKDNIKNKRRQSVVLDLANNTSDLIDEKIQSVAWGRFVRNRNEQLRKLGEEKEEIQEIIAEVSAYQFDKSLLEKAKSYYNKSKSALTGLGIDHKLIKVKDVDKILEQAGFTKKNTEETDDYQNNEIPEIPEKTVNNEIPEIPVNDKIPENNEIPEIPEQTENESPNESTKKGNIGRPKGSKNKKTDILQVKTNTDVDTVADVERNNEKIYQYLLDSGEVDIANYVLDLMTTPSNPNLQKTSDMQTAINQNSDEIKKLSLINTGIYEELEKIREQQIDEQDTSVNLPIQEKIRQEINKEDNNADKSKEKKGFGFWDAIKAVGLGAAFAYFSGLFDNDNFKKSIDFIKNGDFSGLVEHLGGMDWLNGIIKTAALALIAAAIAPIRGAIKVLQVGMKSAKYAAETVSRLVKLLPSIPEIGKYFKSFKSLDGSDISKPTKSSSNDTKSTKTTKSEKLSTNIEEKATKATKAESKTTKKLSSTKVVKKASSVVSKLAKFTKFIPFLGLAIASGTAIYAANKGYQDADKVLGIPTEQLTETHKVASAAGALLEDFLWPVAPKAKTTADLVLKTAAALGMDVMPKGTEVKPDAVKDNNTPNVWMGQRFSDMESGMTGDYEFKRQEYNGPSVSAPMKSVDDFKISDLFTLNTKEANVQNLNPDVLHNFKAMAAEYMDLFGEKIQINSGFRSFEEQEKLKKKYGKNAASPGASMHNYGFAVDIQSAQANKAIKAGLFDKYGFWRPVKHENWHVEASGIDRESVRIAGKKQWKSQSFAKANNITVDETPSNNSVQSPYKMTNVDVDNLTSSAKSSSKFGNESDIIGELTRLDKIRTRLIKKKGTNQGTIEYEREYGELERELNSELIRMKNETSITPPDINKDKKLQSIEAAQSSLIKSTTVYDKNVYGNVAGNGSSKSSSNVNINSINTKSNERVNVLDAFNDF